MHTFSDIHMERYKYNSKTPTSLSSGEGVFYFIVERGEGIEKANESCIINGAYIFRMFKGYRSG